MTMKQALGVVVLVLLACGPGGETPTSSPASPTAQAEEKDPAAVLRNNFAWGDASQPARDWDGDAEACQGRAGEDPNIREGTPPLVKLAAFVKCMEEKGWVVKAENR